MKISKKRLWGIGLAGTAVVAAIVIPVGIVYGAQPQATASITPASNVKTITKQDALATKYTFGTEPSAIGAPDLNETGYAKDDYQSGLFSSSTIGPKTKVGAKAATITFEYRPVPGKLNIPVLQITYFVDTQKGTVAKGFGTSNDGSAAAMRSVPLGIDTFAKVEANPQDPSMKWVDHWLKDSGYVGYVLGEGTDNPKYTKEDSIVLTEIEVKSLPAAATFKAEYKFVIDTERFNNGLTPQAVGSGTLTVGYTVVTPAAYSGKTVYDEARVTYKSPAPADFVPTALPEANATGASDFEIESALTTYEVTAKANDGTGAWIGDKVAGLASLSTYGAGTEITAHFYFKPKPGFAGNYIHTTKKIAIAKKEATNFAYDRIAFSYEHGKLPKDGPNNPTITAEGYKKASPFWSAKVTTMSTIAGPKSPPTGTIFSNWQDIVELNSGTILEISCNYELDDYNYTPAAGTSTKTFVALQTVAITDSTYLVTITKTDSLDYTFGSDPSTIVAPQLNEHVYENLDYDAGAFKESTITAATDIGQKKSTVTFEYRPLEGKGRLPIVRVIYFVDTRKGTVSKGFGTNNDGSATVERFVPAGIDKFANVEAYPQEPAKRWIDQWVRDSGYVGYVLETGSDNPKYFNEDNTVLTEDEMKKFAVGKTFKAKYTFVIDKEHFKDLTPPAASKGTLTVNYTVASAANYTGKTVYDDTKVTFKSVAPADFAPTSLPEPSAPGAADFEIDSTLTIYKITKKANNNTGGKVGDKIANLAAVNTYGAGTEITASFYFKPKMGFAGHYVQTFKKIVIQRKIAPAFPKGAREFLEIQYKVGSYPLILLPYFEGYGNVNFEAVTVTKKSSISNANSPEVGTLVNDWRVLKEWNPGTEITATWRYYFDDFNYALPDGLTDNSETWSKVITIKKGQVNAHSDADISAAKNYIKGSETDPIKVLPAADYEGEIWTVGLASDWYIGAKPDPDVTFSDDFSAIKSLAVGTKFTVRFVVRLKIDYYEISSTSAEKRDYYYHRQVFEVVAAPTGNA